MRVGTVQIKHRGLGKAFHREQMIAYVRRAAALKLDLLCFPELALTGYPLKAPSLARLNRLAEAADGPSARRLMRELRSSQLTIAYGFLESGPAKPYNSYNILNAGGVLHTHRKAHMAKCGDHHESELFAAGDELAVCRLGDVVCGVAVCWDGFFPETMRVLTLKGARLIVWPLAGLGHGHATRTIAPARALENGVYVVVSAVAGPSGDQHFDGGTGVFDQAGHALVEARKNADDLVWTDIAVSADMKPSRQFSERRPGLYREIGADAAG